MVAGVQTTGDISRINALEKTGQNLCSKLDSLLTAQNSEVIGLFNIRRVHAFLVKGEIT